MSEKITDFGENLVRRINYYYVHLIKHSFKIHFTPFVMVITGKLGTLAFLYHSKGGKVDFEGVFDYVNKSFPVKSAST